MTRGKSAAVGAPVVVLVGPQGAGNVGSVARVMANFGCRELRLVTPACDHLGAEARRMAVSAAGLLDAARVFPDLAAALADCRQVFGTSRRFGRRRADFLTPPAMVAAARRRPGPVALVFGREDNGLAAGELELCHRFVTIPTDDNLPSMNLAQAVAVCLYEWRRDGQPPELPVSDLATSGECEGLYRHLQQVLGEIGFLNPQNPEHIMRAFRRLFGRAGLHHREVQILRGMCSAVTTALALARRRDP